jgi:hypothetical protein
MTSTRDEFVDLALEAKEKFEDQFNCSLEAGEGSNFEETEPELAEEFLVKDLIQTPASIPVTVAGRIYVRENEEGEKSVSCLFTATLDDETREIRPGREVPQELAQNKGFQSHYDTEAGEWADLDFRPY